MALTREDALRLDSSDPLAQFRQKFIIPNPNRIYLDGNSLGRLCLSTAGRLTETVSQEWGHDLVESWPKRWINLPAVIGNKIAQIIGAEHGEVVVADSTSVNLFKLAAAAMKRQHPRTKILTLASNFPSDLYVLSSLGQLVLFDTEDELRNAIDSSTALVSISHVDFKSAAIHDLNSLTAKAHAADALTLWDFSHSVGVVEIECSRGNFDLAAGCTYKYLNGGPGAPAFLYVRKDLQDELFNPIQGWFGQQNQFGFETIYTPSEGVQRFTCGTPPILSMSAIEPAIDLVLEASIAEIRRKSILLTDLFVALYDERLADLGFRLQSPRESTHRGSHVSLGHEDALRISRALIQQMDVVPDFRYPDNLRFGFAPLYTTFAEVFDAVERIAKVVRDRIYELYSAAPSQVT